MSLLPPLFTIFNSLNMAEDRESFHAVACTVQRLLLKGRRDRKQ